MNPTTPGTRSAKNRATTSKEVGDRGGDRPARMSPSFASRETQLGGARPVRMSPSFASRENQLGGDRPVRMSPSFASRETQRGGARPVRMSPSFASRETQRGGDRPVRMSPSFASRENQLGGARPVRMSPSIASRENQLGGDRPARMSPSFASRENQLGGARPVRMSPSFASRETQLGGARPVRMSPSFASRENQLGGARPVRMSPSITSRKTQLGGAGPVRMSPSFASRENQLGGDRPVRMSPSFASRKNQPGGARPVRMSPSFASRETQLGGARPVRMSPSFASRENQLGGARPVRMSPSITSRETQLGGARPVRMSPSFASRENQLGEDRPVRMSPSTSSRITQQLQGQVLGKFPVVSLSPLGFYRLIGTPESDPQDLSRQGGARPGRMSPSNKTKDGPRLRVLSRQPANPPDPVQTGGQGPAANTRLRDQARAGLRAAVSEAQPSAPMKLPRGGTTKQQVPLRKARQTTQLEAQQQTGMSSRTIRVKDTKVRFDPTSTAEQPSGVTKQHPRDGKSSPRQTAAPTGAVAPSISDVNATLTTPPAPSGAAPPPTPRKCTCKRKHLGVIINSPPETSKRMRMSSPLSDEEETESMPAKLHVTVGEQTGRMVITEKIGRTSPNVTTAKRKQGDSSQTHLPFKKRKFESVMSLESHDNRPSTSQTSESADCLPRKHNKQRSRGIHPRCAFIRSILPPTPPSRPTTHLPTPERPLRGLTAENITQLMGLVQKISCKRKLNLGPRPSPEEGLSPNKKSKSSTESSPTPPVSSPSSPINIPCLDPGDVESVLNDQGCPISLGAGDFGEVLLMRKKSDGGLLAVKRLKFSNCPQKAYREMLIEIKAMMAVSGLKEFPRFIGIIDESTFAMEFVGDPKTYSAKSVHSCMLDRSLLTTVDRARVSIDITRGLIKLHQSGWLHNDLHNGNALVCTDPTTDQPTAKIIDMGKASRINKPPPPNRFCKSVKSYHYKNCQQIAPDIVEGTSQVNEASDVYSLGILLKDIALNIRDLKYVRNLGIRCCHKNPARRPTLATVLGDLKKFQEKLVARKMKETQMIQTR
ncbi:protein FAM186A-like [Patiria miniata]|uniref:Protein kinase domain-containing protein n=1 Tax=Patiria miniata TaxID=46514 RepID=A0A913ZNP5_PATMI|nr:protein FAM186A-like [Patiria miniata]